MSDLSSFEGSDVVAAKIEIPNAAGGLRDAMEFEPVEMHHADEGYIALHYKVKKVRFDPESKEHPENLVRVHVLDALNAAFIDEDLVGRQLADQRDRMAKRREEAAGVQRLGDHLDEVMPDDAEHAAELVAAHNAGLHPHVMVDGCEACAEREQDRRDERKDLA